MKYCNLHNVAFGGDVCPVCNLEDEKINLKHKIEEFESDIAFYKDCIKILRIRNNDSEEIKID